MHPGVLANCSYLLAGKVTAKVLDVLLNILVVRAVSPALFGLTLHFTLLSNILTFPIKNLVRPAYQKHNHPSASRNLVRLSLLITLPLSAILCYLWVWMYRHLSEHFGYCICLYALAAYLECVSELPQVDSLLKQDYKRISKIETMSLLLKNGSLFLLFQSGTPYLLSFCYSYLVYSLCLLLLWSRSI